MWATIGKLALKAAIYAMGHPEVLQAVKALKPSKKE